jgi:hypothetical protein
MAMEFRYIQSKDNRWSAGQAMESINTVESANKLATGVIKNAPTVTSAGACQGISMWWLIKTALGEDFWDWFGPPAKAAPTSTRANGVAGEPVKFIKEIMMVQSALSGLQGFKRENNHSAAINYILAKTKGHLTNKRGMVVRNGETWRTFATEITVAKGYCFIGFSRAGWGGHAVAAHICNDGKVDFLDPNHGEFETDNASQFITWIADVLGPSYGFDTLTSFELQTLSRPGQ